jgi:hypothetical protein
MNRLNAKAFFALFVFQSMTLSGLLAPFTAQAETRPATAPVKQWVDPGAMEKAKTEAATPLQNGSTSSVTGGDKSAEPDGNVAPVSTPQQSTDNHKASKESDKSKPNKSISHSGAEKNAMPSETVSSSAKMAKPAAAIKSPSLGNNAQTPSGHIRAQAATRKNDARANIEKISKTPAKQMKRSHARHGTVQDDANDTASDVFDPLNGL